MHYEMLVSSVVSASRLNCHPWAHGCHPMHRRIVQPHKLYLKAIPLTKAPVSCRNVWCTKPVVKLVLENQPFLMPEPAEKPSLSRFCIFKFADAGASGEVCVDLYNSLSFALMLPAIFAFSYAESVRMPQEVLLSFQQNCHHVSLSRAYMLLSIAN